MSITDDTKGDDVLAELERVGGVAVVRDLARLRTVREAWRRDGLSVGFVPTMGALHEGHLSLIDIARSRCDRVIASIFVNPTQFAPHEDFDAYPRPFEADAEKLAARRCDLIYAPTPAVMYPHGFATTVRLTGPAQGLETDQRPHFFDGVATVVTKLLNQVRPTAAVFGEKDYQQLLIIRRLVEDLDLAVDILAGPTLREPDGLALSSRNVYLSAEHRRIAAHLSRVLKEATVAIRAGTAPDQAQTLASQALLSAGFDAVDYVAVRHAETLAPLAGAGPDAPVRILAAVRLGEVRLIDNMAVTAKG